MKVFWGVFKYTKLFNVQWDAIISQRIVKWKINFLSIFCANLHVKYFLCKIISWVNSLDERYCIEIRMYYCVLFSSGVFICYYLSSVVTEILQQNNHYNKMNFYQLRHYVNIYFYDVWLKWIYSRWIKIAHVICILKPRLF